jgi:hypothetical protein
MIDEIQKRDLPRELAIDESHRERYRELTKEDSNSPFAGQQMSKLFMFSLGVGYDQGLPKSIDTQAKSIPWSALTANEQWVIKSVAVKEAEDVDILRDGTQVGQIASAYAHGGFEYVDEVIKGPKDTLSTLRTEVVRKHKRDVPDDERTVAGD